MSLEERFGLPAPKREETSVALNLSNSENDALVDFQDTRTKMTKIISVGSKAIEDLGCFGTQLMPEHYLAMSALIRATTAASTTLLKLHEQINDLKNPKEKDGPKEQHSHVHVSASTSELNDIIRGAIQK